MNTYNDNLQQTVINTLSALATQQVKLDSQNTSAKYNLYYAQGAEITASDKLADTKKSTKYADSVNQQGRLNDYQAVNLLATVTGFNADVTASRANSATAAANIQIASNAIALLASDLGAAMNIASASLFNTDTYYRIQEANAYVNEVANEAKALSFKGMEASALSSEIIGTDLLNQTTAVKAKLDQLLSATQAQFDQISALIITESQTLGGASKAERQAEGLLNDADAQLHSINEAYTNTNQQLNYDLKISNSSQTGFTASFSTLGEPHPRFQSADASKIKIPAKAGFPRYFIALVPEDKKALFSSDQAQQLFAQYGGDSISDTGAENQRFYQVTQFQGQSAQQSFTYVGDAYGMAIEPGKNYVAYLYIELSMEYKRFIGNFCDILSAPSQVFVPANSLPEIQKRFSFRNSVLQFNAKGKGPAALEYRCILVEVSRPYELNLLVADDDNDAPVKLELQISGSAALEETLQVHIEAPASSQISAQNADVPIYFDTTIAEQVAPSNFTKALSRSLGASANDATSDAADCQDNAIYSYEVSFNQTTTDNFGNKLRSNTRYKPYVLAIVDSDEAGAYLTSLTEFEPIIVNVQ